MATNATALAEGRVNGPGIAALVMGILGMLTAVGLMIVQLVNIAQLATNDYAMPEVMATSVATLAYYAFTFVVSVVVTAGGWKMRNLESYPLAMTATIAMMIPCCSIHPCCWPLALGFGIWSLVVLMDDDVKSSFQ